MMLISSFIAPTFAQAQDDALPDSLPDVALLEYLAELVEVDGELVGPLDMATATDKTKSQKEKHEQGEKSKDKSEDQSKKQAKNPSEEDKSDD